MSVDVELLKAFPYFSGLDRAELESSRGFFFERKAQRGEFVLKEGEHGETLYFVASGVVKEFMTSTDGKEQTLRLIRPGESFNDVPIFDGGPNPASAVAMSPLVLYGIRKGDMERVMREHPSVALNAIKALAGRVRYFVSLVEDLSFRHVIGRVAKILLEQARTETGSGPRLTQQEMAAMAGTAREMIGRALKALEEDGAIRLDRHRILITDRDALREMAGVTLETKVTDRQQIEP